MAESFIESFAENTQDRLNKSMLECSMLFALNRNATLSKGRNEMFLKSVFAIITSENREWTEKDVHDVFKDRFSKEYDLEIIKKAMQKLLKEGMLRLQGKGMVAHEQFAKQIQESIKEIDEKTKALFDSIISRVEEFLAEQLEEGVRNRVEASIKRTFNLYMRMYGFEMFVNKGTSDNVDVIEDEDIVKAAMDGLDDKVGEALVSVLSELIEKPTREQAATMALWMKSYLSTQVMRLDPQLSELEGNSLKGKKFILDTDFLLYCLTSHPKQSKGYQRLLKALRKVGCKLIIPEDVVIEILKHAQCAESNYRRFTRMLKAVKRDVIEQKANNVFVKDYCLYDMETKHHQTIRQYMYNNYLSDEEPLEYMKQLIRDSLRIEPESVRLEVDDDFLQYEEEMTKKIFYRTKRADSDKWRTDEEIETLSKTDARLYLSTLSFNKDIKLKDDTMLRANAYLVTFTTKSIKSAQEMGIYRNFVTRPELLINLMAEIGEFDETKDGFVNLFDNPFLAHILDENWEMIRNLAEAGLNMHNKSITKLKEDLGEVYHRYLTRDADAEVIDTMPNFDVLRIGAAKTFFEFAEEVNKLNYQLVPEMQEMVDEYKEETKKRMTAEEKQKIAEDLLAKKVHGYRVYMEKTDSKKKRVNLGYKKQKKGAG